MTSNEKWKVAPTVTSGNSDRLGLKDARAKQFAKEINQILVKQKKKISSKNILLPTSNKSCEDNPELIGNFAKGALAIATINQCRVQI